MRFNFTDRVTFTLYTRLSRFSLHKNSQAKQHTVNKCIEMWIMQNLKTSFTIGGRQQIWIPQEEQRRLVCQFTAGFGAERPV